MSKVYALVDCNNFFVSCERVFNLPSRYSPTVVLSNNDGCIISRSQEAKDLGIKMGEPYFRVKDFLDAHGVKVFSSNFPLYSDMSHRVMSLLEEFSPGVEIYSVDEAFLDFSSFRNKDLALYAKQIRSRVLQCTGIPISIGIAKTKTLAKLANHLAKKHQFYGGVMDFNLFSAQERDKYLQFTPVEEVWGIGRKLSRKLLSMGVRSAYDFTKLSSRWVKNHMGVTGFRTQQELLGIDCDCRHEDIRKSLVVSRSLAETVDSFDVMSGIIAKFVHSAGETLRREGVEAHYLTVFIRTNYKALKENQYSNYATVSLSEYTSSSTLLLAGGVSALKKIYRPGFKYKKVGISLSDIRPEGQQSNFLSSVSNLELFKAIDSINRKWKGVIKLGRETLHEGRIGARQMSSPSYTSDWNSLLTVR